MSFVKFKGNTHGVYVLPESNRNDGNCRLSPCLEVLQKPNYATMETKKALFKFGEKTLREFYKLYIYDKIFLR